jgi:hypothetical protein
MVRLTSVVATSAMFSTLIETRALVIRPAILATGDALFKNRKQIPSRFVGLGDAKRLTSNKEQIGPADSLTVGSIFVLPKKSVEIVWDA